MHPDTVTPCFDAFAARLDRNTWEPTGERITWRLHGGMNRLSVRARNHQGVGGPVSSLAIEMVRPEPVDASRTQPELPSGGRV